MRRMRVRAAIGSIIVAIGAVTACSNQSPILIATVGPYHTSTGMDNLRGVQMAVAEANERGGIRGRKIELVVENDSSNGERAVRIAEQIINDSRIVAVSGHMTSNAMIATAPLYDGRLPAVSSMATSPQLTDISPWVFRVTVSDSTLGADLARFALSKRWRRVAILYENDVWGRRLSRAFQLGQRRVGGVTVSADPIVTRGLPPETVDFGVYVRTYARIAPDVVMIIASNTEIGLRFLNKAKELDFQIPILGSDGLSPQRLASNPVADGVYIPSTFLAEEPDSVARDFRARFKARYGFEADMYSALGYDATLAILSAIRIGGPNRDLVRDALASSELATIRGATGPVSFLHGDRRERFGGLVRIEGGKVSTQLLWKNVNWDLQSVQASSQR